MCDYCQSTGRTLGNTGEKVNPLCAYANHGIVKGRLSLQLVVNGADEFVVMTPIKYCPMCGRELKTKG